MSPEAAPQVSGMGQLTERALLKGSTFNLLGQIIPILVALISVPIVVSRMGTERFGILTVAWAILTYFSLADFGIGRAITRELARTVGHAQEKKRQLIWSLLSFLLVIGTLSGLLCFSIATWLSHDILQISPELDFEAAFTIQMLGLMLPFVMLSNGLRGILEAHQRFGLVNLVQSPLSLGNNLIPLVLSFFTQSLAPILMTFVLLRGLGFVFFFLACRSVVPEMRHFARPRGRLVSESLGYGTWLTISNVISPLFQYFDRFWIGHALGMSAVAYYALPSEMINKFWIIPGSLISVLFPAFSAIDAADKNRVQQLYIRSTKFLFFFMVPPTLLVAVFAHEGLAAWMNADFANNSSTVLQWLSLAVIINCLGFIPATLLQALNRPDIPAKIHMVLFPPYVILLMVWIKVGGLAGAAIAYLCRVFLDTILLFASARFVIPKTHWNPLKVLASAVFTGSLFLIGTLLVDPATKVAFYVVANLLLFIFFWFGILQDSEQRRILNFFLDTVERRLPRLQSPGSTKKKQRVGIALAAYKPNRAFFITQLKSIQDQTHLHWKCLVCFDSPLDEFRNEPELKPFFEDPRFSWHENEKRMGFKKNFETAVREVLKDPKIDAIAFSDQDDIWFPQKLEVLIEKLNASPEGSVVFSDMRLLVTTHQSSAFTSETVWHVEHKVPENNRVFHTLLRNHVTGAACLFDASLARRFSTIPDSVPYHDHWFSILASYFGSVVAVDQSLVAYRQHGSNVVGIVPFTSVFYLSPSWSPMTVLQKACRNWLRTCALLKELESLKIEVPWLYRYAICSRFDLGFGLVLFGFLNFFADPPFARVCIVLALGKVASLFVKPYGDDPE